MTEPDIVERLRKALPAKEDWDGFDPLMAEAADEITRLRARTQLEHGFDPAVHEAVEIAIFKELRQWTDPAPSMVAPFLARASLRTIRRLLLLTLDKPPRTISKENARMTGHGHGR